MNQFLNIHATENVDGALRTLKLRTEDNKNIMFVVADHNDDCLTIEISGQTDLMISSKKSPARCLSIASKVFLLAIEQMHPFNEAQLAVCLSDFMSRTDFLNDDELKEVDNLKSEAGIK